MKRSFVIHNIHEIGCGSMFVDGKPRERFEYEQRVAENTNPTLVANFKKVCEWIKTNYPNLNGVFPCPHNAYYMLRLCVEDGVAVLETGSWGWSHFEMALSADFSEFYAQGSNQSAPYRFEGLSAFRNDRLEEFLREWNGNIKNKVIALGNKQNNVYSESFTA